MMTETGYRIAHLLGILMTFASIGALIACARAGKGASGASRFGASIGHGVGLTIVLITGVGLAHKMGIALDTGWLLAKIGILLLLGGSIALIKRQAGLGTLWGILVIALGATAGYMVWVRPF